MILTNRNDHGRTMPMRSLVTHRLGIDLSSAIRRCYSTNSGRLPPLDHLDLPTTLQSLRDQLSFASARSLKTHRPTQRTTRITPSPSRTIWTTTDYDDFGFGAQIRRTRGLAQLAALQPRPRTRKTWFANRCKLISFYQDT